MKIKITDSAVEGLPIGKKDALFWDNKVPRFGVKATPAGNLIYVVQYRAGGQVKRYTIGRHGEPWTADMARGEARRLLAIAAAGGDPANQRPISAEKPDAQRARRRERERCSAILRSPEAVGRQEAALVLALDTSTSVAEARHVLTLIPRATDQPRGPGEETVEQAARRLASYANISTTKDIYERRRRETLAGPAAAEDVPDDAVDRDDETVEQRAARIASYVNRRRR